jgi:hypothetical protein
VQLDKKTIADLTPVLVRSNVGNRAIKPMVTTLGGKEIPMSTLHYDDAAFGGRGKSYSTSLSLKPHPTFGHKNPEDPNAQMTPELALQLGAFPASKLAAAIKSNPQLDNQGAAGQAVKSIAEQIEQGQVPTIPELDKVSLGVILNDAFEYLGPMQLVYGTAEFPNSEEFYKHLGTDLKSLVMYFPGSVNHPLADSIAMTNRKTENTVFVSSKGGKSGTGAPSSISAIQMSENMKQSIGKDPAVTFINFLQQYKKGGRPSWRQPFDTANWIQQNYPNKLGELSKFLPFSNELMSWLGDTWNNRNNGVPESIEEIPEEFRPLYAYVESQSKGSHHLFYNLRYLVITHIHDAVNSGVIVPNFSSRMLELLGENYISLATKAKGKPGAGQYITTVKWPSKMGGKVTLEHKAEASKWATSMTWLLN